MTVPTWRHVNLSMNHWERIHNSPDSQRMIAQKTRFIGVSTVFFIIFYFSLPFLVGYWPDLLAREVWGVVNWAYLFAFSQFLLAWALAYSYMILAERFDRTSARILADTTAVGDEAESKERE